jgi:hypothetical protein
MPAIINFRNALMPRIIFLKNFFLLKLNTTFGSSLSFSFDTKLYIKGIISKRKSKVLQYKDVIDEIQSSKSRVYTIFESVNKSINAVTLGDAMSN